jgi:3-oxoacyl-[acyl-carrier protein] reductase
MKLLGKRAIVTGSSTGIGRAIAIRLAGEGASVIVNSRASKAQSMNDLDATVGEIRRNGGIAQAIAASVHDPADVKALVQACLDFYGGVDIVVNNAGIYSPTAIDACSLEEWHSLLRTNLDGPFLMTREVLPHMKKQRWGRILNAGSSAGFGAMGTSGYAASKSALFGFTRAIAADYGPYGITANCYNPEGRSQMAGISDDKIFEAMLRHYEARGYCTPAEIQNLRSIGGPEGIGPWIAYLCSESADYINGQIFAVESRRIALISDPHEVRTLSNFVVPLDGVSADELERTAPLAFPLENRWPKRFDDDFERWERA